MKFKFTISGTARGNAPWKTEGTVEVEGQGQFPEALRLAQMQSFQLLVEGKAEYGKPGPCGGPYRITRFVLTEYEPPTPLEEHYFYPHSEQVDGIHHLRCTTCGKRCSSGFVPLHVPELNSNTIVVRAIIQCPECLEKESHEATND